MEDITLALAILLGAGFFAAKLGQFFKLPSVTGYICIGLLLGPSGFNIITKQAMVGQLGHFTQIALMLIAFGIGEHLELKRLRYTAKNVIFISTADVVTSFLVVSGGMFLGFKLATVGGEQWHVQDYFVSAILLGTVSMATAPAAILHVMRELKASGRFTTSLLQIVAMDNGLAIMMFGIAVALTGNLIGSKASVVQGIAGSLGEIFLSLLLGVLTGLLIDFLFQKLKRRGEMLTAGLALLLLCGEGARVLELSPLLAGMAVGFIIVNRDQRDVRLFRVLNAFEAPIYVLFFTLAGAHLDLSSLAVSGWLGGLYFILRSAGKYVGSMGGARLAKAGEMVENNIGPALIPQAGVAIGLIFFITADESLGRYGAVITPIVLAGVFFSELIGPVFVRRAIGKVGECMVPPPPPKPCGPPEGSGDTVKGAEEVELVPWSWGRLSLPEEVEGCVVFGAAHSGTAAGLARMTTLFSHFYGAKPLAARIVLPKAKPTNGGAGTDVEEIFAKVHAEVENLGYGLDTAVVEADHVAQGLLKVAEEQKAKGIVLGYPLKGTAQEFQRVVEAVAKEAPCPIIVIRFSGILHTEKILVPVADMSDLYTVQDTVRALAEVGRHRLRLLRLMPPDAREEELLNAEYRMLLWTKQQNMAPGVRCRAVATECRLETILHEEKNYDLVIMAASQFQGLHRLFFGSLAASVSQHSTKPLVMVYEPK